MTHRFAALMFTPVVKSIQSAMGSRGTYERFEEPDAPPRDRLGTGESGFIAARDSFYMATVSETGWPYVQHRGGQHGFLKVLDEKTLGFADYKGNRQYVSVGNLLTEDRVSLFLVDYPNRRRLKILGRARIVDAQREPELLEALRDLDYDARVERGIVIALEGFDWNCPQHITPRFTEAEVAQATAPLIERLRVAEAAASHRHGPSSAPLGDGPLELVVTGVRRLTPRVRAYELRALDGGDLPPFSPGAHLTVPVMLENTPSVRSYSISSDPARRDTYEIAVLADGLGSEAVHRDYAVDLHIRCGSPVNAFPLLDEDHPVLLLAGGIGITPIRAMAHALLRAGRAFVLHYAVRRSEEAVYLDELVGLLGERLLLHTQDNRLDVGTVLAEALPGAAVYVCGPERMIDAVQKEAHARGWPEDRVRFERFSPPGASEMNVPFELSLAKSDRKVLVAAGETALAAIERAGVVISSGCRAGSCGACTTRLLAGNPEHRDSVLTPEERAAGAFTPCVSRAKSGGLVLDL